MSNVYKGGADSDLPRQTSERMFKRQGKWKDDQPIYRQIMESLVTAIIEGAHPEGELIPSVRQVAADYGVSTLTAAKVLQELAREGMIEKRRGIGFVVLPGLRKKLAEQERRKFLEQEWPELQVRLKRMDIDVADLMKGN